MTSTEIVVKFNLAEARFVRDLLGALTPAWIEVLGVEDPLKGGTHEVSASLAAYLKMRTVMGEEAL